MSVTPSSSMLFDNIIEPLSTSRRASILAISGPGWFDNAGDFASGLLPGILFVIGSSLNFDDPESRSWTSLIPVAMMFVWYGLRFMMGRIHRIADMRIVMVGYVLSIAMIVTTIMVKPRASKSD